MVYQYRGTQTIASELERQEQLKAELEAEKAKLREAMTVRKENERLEAEIARTQHRFAELSKRSRLLPPPVYGGRAGLEAATREIEAYDARSNPRKERKGPSHGTWRRYYDLKCRCEPCKEWAKAQSIKNAERYQQRQKQAA